MRILLKISYDGTNYFGWQKQPLGNTIQNEIETALSKIYKRPIHILGSSRTDAGVHALSQYATYTIDETDLNIQFFNIPRVINKFLREDIKVLHAQSVPDEFHPIASTLSKTYHYNILNSKLPNPLIRNHYHFSDFTYDLLLMQEACKFFIGEHDFKSFCSKGTSVKSTIREVYDFTVTKNSDVLTFAITGEGFLYNMVRIAVGTVLLAGQKKMEPIAIKNIINSKDRTTAGATVPANGLVLVNVNYDKKYNIL